MAEPQGHYTKWNKPVAKETKTVWFHLYEISRVVNFIEPEVEEWLGGSWEEEKRNYLIDMVSVLQMKGVLGIDYTTMNVLITIELYLKKVNFIYFFPQLKQIIIN